METSSELLLHRLKLVTSAAPALISFICPEYHYQYVNRTYEDWFGRPCEAIEGKHVRDVLGESAYQVLKPFLERALDGESVRVETRVPYKMGARDVDASYVPHFRADGTVDGIVALVCDIGERKQAEGELRRSRDLLAVLLTGVSDGVLAVDPGGNILFGNETAARLAGFESVEALLRSPLEFGDRFQIRDAKGGALPPPGHPLMAAMTRGEPAEATLELTRKDTGERRWALMNATPVKDETGSVRMAILFWRDVTEARRAAERQAFLSGATKKLSESLDYEDTLGQVARLAVPSFADWTIVDIAESDRHVSQLAVAHSDPTKRDWLVELRNRFPLTCDDPTGPVKVIRTGEPELAREIPDEMLVAFARDPEYVEILRSVGLRSYICVPLKGRKRILGALTFVTTDSGRHYEEQDLDFAQELARRASTAIEHAALYSEAQRSNREKDEFLATLAHELRNPLAPVMNATAVLRAPGGPRGRAVEVIDRQVHHFARMVDDLLEVSRITRGKITLRKERLDIAPVVSDVVIDREESARAAGIALTADIPAAPIWVDADRTRIAQVLSNLLTNAIKFTQRGGSIAVSLRELSESGEVEVRVQDTGIGIERGALSRIFEPFTQSDRTLDRSRGGLGLGLSVVKSLVTLHGGSVGAESEGPGRGSTFWVRLAAFEEERGQARGRRGPQPVAAVPPHPRKRILIVEDNRDAADMLEEVLAQHGHQVEVLYSGERAAEVTRTFRPHVVLCDIDLPTKNGFKVADEIRSERATRETKLVAISGYGMAEDRDHAREAGFDRHLTKPVDPAVLEQVIAELGAD